MKDELPKRLFHNGFIVFVDGSIILLPRWLRGKTVDVNCRSIFNSFRIWVAGSRLNT